MKNNFKSDTEIDSIAPIEVESPEQKKCFWFCDFIVATRKS
jgi:hypothetical protein